MKGGLGEVERWPEYVRVCVWVATTADILKSPNKLFQKKFAAPFYPLFFTKFFVLRYVSPCQLTIFARGSSLVFRPCASGFTSPCVRCRARRRLPSGVTCGLGRLVGSVSCARCYFPTPPTTRLVFSTRYPAPPKADFSLLSCHIQLWYTMDQPQDGGRHLMGLDFDKLLQFCM